MISTYIILNYICLSITENDANDDLSVNKTHKKSKTENWLFINTTLNKPKTEILYFFINNFKDCLFYEES